MSKNTAYLISLGLFSAALLLSFGVRAAVDGVTVFGSGEPHRSTDLPAGEFRASLDSLSAVNRHRAVQWLQSVEFTSQDLAYMKLDSQGGIYYADQFNAGTSSDTSAGKAGTDIPALTVSAVLKLHSNPGAPKTIFVDFTGGVISDTAWNRTAGISAWNASPYDADNNPESFSAAEVADMAEIWRRISEDFTPFNVDVTTEAPRSVEANTNWILITNSKAGSRQSLPQPTSDSVSYMNVSGFSHTSFYSPAFVYFNNLSGSSAIAEAASHAAGHLYGLSHDSMPVSAGHGSVAWSPIMGLGPFGELTQWSRGGYTNAANSQNEIGILIGALDLRRDDHDDSRFDTGTSLQADASGRVTASTPVTDPGNHYPANKGVIGSRDDLDVFVFEAGEGMVDLSVTPAWLAFDTSKAQGENLDVQVILFDVNGKKLAENNPLNETDSTIRTHVAAGRYVLEISGAGVDDGYGSLGQYFINGRIPVPGVDAGITVSAR